MLIKIPKSWELPESAATTERAYRSRRQVLRDLGYGAVGLSALFNGGCFLSVDDPNAAGAVDNAFADDTDTLYPAPRNEEYVVAERPVSTEEIVTRFNNFFEFSILKDRVWELVDRFETSPWTVEVSGHCHDPQTIDLDELIRSVSLEERIYRLRCVEAWSIVVPWTGFPVSALLDRVRPTSNATHVRFMTALRPEQMPGIDALGRYPWAYHEGLTIEEAYNEMAFLVTGAYGAPLQRQNGAPIRLVTPWKYGYKSIKSIVAIELVDSEPPTFWNTIAPREYPFESNVDPEVPHPRWSQATERFLPDIDSQERLPTLRYNGYAEYVAHLYE